MSKMSDQLLEAEYKKTGIKPSDIALLRQWVQTQPHLPDKYISDLDLILIYHSCDYSTEVAKQVIDLNLTLRTLFSNIFGERSVDEKIINVLKTQILVRLPVVSKYTYVYYRMYQDGSNFDDFEIVRACMMILDLWQQEDGTWPGIVFLVDLSEYNLKHIAKVHLQTVRNLFYFLQEALYMKIKSLHFLNIPSVMDNIMKLMRPFLKKELLDTLNMHQAGSETMKNIVPIEALPKELGGKFKSFDEIQKYTLEYLLQNQEYFVNENKRRVNESLRPGKPKTLTDIFGGVEGSFKQLDID